MAGPRAGKILVVLAALAVAHPANAEANAPACSGNDPKQARVERRAALSHYRHAVAQSPVDAAEMESALRAFDAACAAGDGQVLELRAYALAALGRYVEAADSLDAFLKDHPLASLPKEARDRVNANRPAIAGKVATLRVQSDTPNTRVSVDGKPMGTAPLEVRVLAQPVSIEVAADGYEGAKRDVALGGGDVHEETFAMRKLAQASTGPAAPEGEEVHTEAQPTAQPGAPAAHSSLTTWIVVSGVASLAFAGAGVGFTFWRQDRTSTYDAKCLGPTQPAGCDSTLTQYEVARDLQVVSFSLAGALAITAGTLFVLERSSSAKGSANVSVACVPGALGMACGGRF